MTLRRAEVKARPGSIVIIVVIVIVAVAVIASVGGCDISYHVVSYHVISYHNAIITSDKTTEKVSHGC